MKINIINCDSMDENTTRNDDEEMLGPPNDDKLNNMFFTYGIFKPGQLAYSQIKKYVDDEPIKMSIKYEMFYRDGIPLIANTPNDKYETSGYLIKFNDPEAYNIIGKAEPSKLYEWGELDGKPINILFGIDYDKGTFNNREYPTSNYDFREDDYFDCAMEIVKEFIDKNLQIKEPYEFFQYQMHYILLWSIIERFGTFKYGKSSINQNNKQLAKHHVFKRNLKKVGRIDRVYSSKDHGYKELEPPNWWSIKYYYTIRSNIVHRGKSASFEDKQKIKLSLTELYFIFKAVLDYEFKNTE